MKIRMGFVSNSSSSSFCIYGCTVNKNFGIDILTEKAIELLKSKDFIEDDEITDNYEAMEKIPVPFTWCGEEGYIAIGNSPWEMNDNETKLEFQKRTEDQIKEYFKIDKFDWECEDYYC